MAAAAGGGGPNTTASSGRLTLEMMYTLAGIGPDGYYTDVDYNSIRPNLLPTVTTAVPSLLYYDSDGQPTNRIPAGAFKRVLYTSDIHADYRQFIHGLAKAGLITLPEGLDLTNPFVMRDLRIITDTVWNAESTLFVIVGDLVDGKRRNCYNSEYTEGASQNTVNDAVGTIELLLHCFIYNLRLSAREKGSDILFTWGNHDMDALFFFHLVTGHVHTSCLQFFSDGRVLTRSNLLLAAQRRAAHLKPFYACSPYITLDVGTSEGFVTCVHGGLHGQRSKGLIDVDTAQRFLFSGLPDLFPGKSLNTVSALPRLIGGKLVDAPEADRKMADFFDSLRSSSTTKDSPLWTRLYAYAGAEGEPSEATCDRLTHDLGDTTALVVVGHCPTTGSGMEMNKFLAAHQAAGNDEYAGCGGAGGDGCVVIGCEGGSYKTRVAFVDTMMSECFNAIAGKVDRRIEYLEVRTDPFTISRWNVTAAAQRGGRRRPTRRRHHTKRKTRRGTTKLARLNRRR
jgi:hypothetical protein